MEKLRLGRTGMMVSKLGFGGIPIQRLSDEEAVAVVKRCVELGITFLDTANAYTTSEARIGQAIKGQRETLIIATKTQARNREGVEAHLKLSLQHLGTDYIDLYQFHGVSDFKNLDMVLEPNGPMAVAQEAKKAGMVRHIGITSHSMDVAKKAVQSDLFETIMFPFNFITDEAAEELLPLARKHDVGFIAMKPMAGGMVDNATIAFKYLFQFPDVVPIPGIEKIREIEEIVGILKKSPKMTAAELREMQRLRQELGARFCHRCDYCQPCAVEIPISTVLSSRSFAKRLPPERFFSGWIGAGIDRAAECTECGDCETRCPYHLPIREMLAEHVKWYQAEKKRYDELLATRGAGTVRP
jgi:predicted aldo/keto reductase-like oxidoreductase